jgi:hypothetical protein
MKKSIKKRLERRREAASQLSGRAARQLHARLITGWSGAYAHRFRISLEEAEAFRLQKTRELRDLGADESTVRLLESAFMSQRFAIEERRLNAGALTVPTHLIGNYEAVEMLELREARQR